MERSVVGIELFPLSGRHTNSALFLRVLLAVTFSLLTLLISFHGFFVFLFLLDSLVLIDTLVAQERAFMR